MLLFDFSKPQTAALFHPIGDQVMGGVSRGVLEADEGHAVFSGNISYENQGGFASVRSKAGSWDLLPFEGIELDVRGDGLTYKLSLTTDPRYDSVVYRARFTPPPNRWSIMRIPFGEFSPSYRGNVVPEAPSLDPSKINTFGFLISDRQEGPFRLAIKIIKAY